MTRARPGRVVTHVDGATVHVGRRRLVSFGGCDYLGLAKHDEVVAAAHAGLDFLGASASASRTTTGTMDCHVALERTLAAYFGTEDAIHFAAGWLAPQAAARALAPECDVVLVDAVSHPALADAAALTGLPVRTYAHVSAPDARRAARGARPLILTEGPGAPLRALARIATARRGHVVVDDAHGVGVLGAEGRGSAEAARATGPRVHVTGSLAKAFGGQGGFVVGSHATIDAVRARADVVAGATPLAPSAAAAAEAALRVASDGELLRALRRNVARMRRALGVRGPAFPWIHVGGGRTARDLAAVSRALAARGFLVPHVRYFGLPPGGVLKVTVTAIHTPEQIDALAAALRDTLPA